jgi:intracellular multiplication protein IcmW
MLDLSEAAIEQFWQERQDPFLVKIIKAMEAVEDWTMDGDPEFESALTAFAASFEGVENFEISAEPDFVMLLLHTRLSRSLRIMQHIDFLNPGSASKLLIHAEVAGQDTSDPGGLFLNRNLIFERLQLFSRIFAPERFKIAAAVVEQVVG